MQGTWKAKRFPGCWLTDQSCGKTEQTKGLSFVEEKQTKHASAKKLFPVHWFLAVIDFL